MDRYLCRAMAIASEFTGRGVVHVCSGVVTGADLVAMSRFSHDAPGRLDFGLVDFSAVTELRVTNADLRMVATEDQITASRIAPRAVVALVTPTTYIAGTVRIWEILTEALGWRCETFTSRAEAERWISSVLEPAEND